MVTTNWSPERGRCQLFSCGIFFFFTFEYKKKVYSFPEIKHNLGLLEMIILQYRAELPQVLLIIFRQIREFGREDWHQTNAI